MTTSPPGTVTFLFTDVEGSSQLWEKHPDEMGPALAHHDVLLRGVIESHGGRVFKTVGDAFHAAFPTARQAVDAAVEGQQRLLAGQSTAPRQLLLRVRMAVHTGQAEQRDGDYFGQPLNRLARLLALGHGQQILLSEAAAGLVRDDLPPQTRLQDLGIHRLRDLDRPERV